jgi:transposase-like protein
MFECERTKPYVIRYALYLYFLGLSLRSTSKAIEPFANRSYVSVWYWIQRFDPKRIYPSKRKRVPAFIIDETQIQIGYNEAWLWVALELIDGQILGVYIYLDTGISLLQNYFLNHL